MARECRDGLSQIRQEINFTAQDLSAAFIISKAADREGGVKKRPQKGIILPVEEPPERTGRTALVTGPGRGWGVLLYIDPLGRNGWGVGFPKGSGLRTTAQKLVRGQIAGKKLTRKDVEERGRGDYLFTGGQSEGNDLADQLNKEEISGTLPEMAQGPSRQRRENNHN